MIEQRVPVVARWMVYALGVVEGRRIRKPVDPVAAWLLREHPSLLPSIPQPALLCTMRARAQVVDGMIADELASARTNGEDVSYWSFGGGFDARWYRLAAHLDDVVVEHREVDTLDIIELKRKALESSPFAERWTRVIARPEAEDAWVPAPAAGTRPVVVVEAGAGRLDEDVLRGLLVRIRASAPTARLIVGLPSPSNASDGHWTHRSLARIGWKVVEDWAIAQRGRLVGPGGGEVCPGMYPFRVVRLVAREPLQ